MSSCKHCGLETAEGAEACSLCMAAHGETGLGSVETGDRLPPAAPSADADRELFCTSVSSMDGDLKGIGGWLILVAIGLAVSPFLSLHGIYRDLNILYGDRYQPGLVAQPALASVIMFEAVTNTLFFLGMIWLNFLFYTKKRAFRASMILFLGTQFLLLLADHVMALRFNPHSSEMVVARSFMVCLFWIPYYMRSRRVEVTFVN